MHLLAVKCSIRPPFGQGGRLTSAVSPSSSGSCSRARLLTKPQPEIAPDIQFKADQSVDDFRVTWWDPVPVCFQSHMDQPHRSPYQMSHRRGKKKKDSFYERLVIYVNKLPLFSFCGPFLECVTQTGCHSEINRRKWSGESLLSLSHVLRVLFQTVGLKCPQLSRPSSIIEQQLLL